MVTAPPYDVISALERERLARLHPNNIVHLTLGEQLPDDTPLNNRYTRAAGTFRQWLDCGVLETAERPEIYIYRLDFTSNGIEKAIAGMVGALTLQPLGTGGIYGHERTIPGPKADRLNLWRATRANLEPLWFFASRTLPGFKDLVDVLEAGAPLADMTDPQRIRHRIWALPDAQARSIQRELAGVPVVVADGHHRYETSVTYRDERRVTDGPGPWDATLAMITDPVEYAPAVEPIHRLVDNLQFSQVPGLTGFRGDLAELCQHVEKSGPGTFGVASAEALGTIQSSGEIDTVWLAEQILEPMNARVRYEHDLELVSQQVYRDGVLAFIMPATPVEVVALKALEGVRLPPKTTLFTPKPRSGLLMRDLQS